MWVTSPFELARRANIDERLARTALLKRFVLEGADLGIQPRGRHWIPRLRKSRNLARIEPTFGLPFGTPAIEQLHLLMTEKPEYPERVGGPPVGLVTVENHRCVRGDAVLRRESGKRIGSDVVPLEGIIQIRAPVDVNGVPDVTGAVEKDVFVAFHDADGRIIEMLGEPGGFDQAFRACVIAHSFAGSCSGGL